MFYFTKALKKINESAIILKYRLIDNYFDKGGEVKKALSQKTNFRLSTPLSHDY